MSETAIAVSLFLLLCYLGTLFGRLVFVYPIEHGATRFCFSLVFALSTFIFILVLLDASLTARIVFSVSFTTRVLRLTILADLIAMLVICPLCFLCSLLRDLRFRHCFSLLVGCIVFGFVFSDWVPLFHWARSVSYSRLQRDSVFTLWDAATAAITLLGVVAVGVLSGYAAVMTPLAFIRPFGVRCGGDGAQVALGVLAKRQRYLLSLWASKQSQIIEAWGAVTPSVPVASKGLRLWSWMTRSLRSSARGRNNGDIAKLKAESDGIRAVSMAVFLQMNDIDSLVRSAESATTWWRRWVEALLGMLLLLHTVLKLVFTVINLLRWGFSPRAASVALPEDTATRLVGFLETYGLATPHGDGAEQRVVWVSLALNAWMIVSSIRGLLLTVFRLVMTYTTFLSVDTTVLAMTTGMGAYFVGQLLLLRLSPTLETQSVLTTVLRELLPRSQLHYQLNDMVFVVICIFTVVAQLCLAAPPTVVG